MCQTQLSPACGSRRVDRGPPKSRLHARGSPW